MGFYQFRTEQWLPADKEKVWTFISDPKNLAKITPDYMNFVITSLDEIDGMYPGMIVSYRVSPLPFFRSTWVTEITEILENQYFIDEQRVGPYSLWHHQHHIETKDGGTLMTDIVSYKPPFGFLGSIANWLFIEGQLKKIFDYRRSRMEEIFPSTEEDT